MDITCLTPSDALCAASRIVLEDGRLTKPRGLETLELHNLTILVQEPWHLPLRVTGRGRPLSSFIGAVECLQLVGQVTAPELMTSHAPQFERYMNDGILLGAYGPRVYGQLARVVDLLLEDPDSRQAVITIYDGRQDLGRPGVADVPCTLSVQFFVRDNTLCARTSMRSNDVYMGLPYDLVQFIGLQGAVAAALGLQIGWYAHTVGSAHMYTKDISSARAIQADGHHFASSRRLWTGCSMEIISRRARLMLAGQWDGEGTAFERYLAMT